VRVSAIGAARALKYDCNIYIGINANTYMTKSLRPFIARLPVCRKIIFNALAVKSKFLFSFADELRE
jgi:hypothetical protein